MMEISPELDHDLPEGYFTLSEKGLILEVNLTAASLLGGGG
jgi:hypothetical protein